MIIIIVDYRSIFFISLYVFIPFYFFHGFNLFSFVAVDTSCPEAPFEKVECFNDKHKSNQRPLPDYLFSDRDPSIKQFSGQMVDWRNWDMYLPKFVCRCAKAAKNHNTTFFGMQFFGK